jgi:hypothetical protein
MGPHEFEETSYLVKLCRGLTDIGQPVVLSPISAPLDEADAIQLLAPDEQWLGLLSRTVDAARCVLLSPGESPGVLVEMNILRSQERTWSSRVVVFMPPRPRLLLRIFVRYDETVAGRWNRTKATLERLGWNLPLHHPAGMFYIPNHDYSVARSESLGGRLDRYAVRRALRRLLTDSEDRGIPLRDLLRDVLQAGWSFRP